MLAELGGLVVSATGTLLTILYRRASIDESNEQQELLNVLLEEQREMRRSIDDVLTAAKRAGFTVEARGRLPAALPSTWVAQLSAKRDESPRTCPMLTSDDGQLLLTHVDAEIAAKLADGFPAPEFDVVQVAPVEASSSFASEMDAALGLLRMNRARLAIELLEGVMRDKRNGDPTLLNLLGVCLLRDGQALEGLQCFQRALLAGEAPHLAFNEGVAHYELGAYKAASACFLRALRAPSIRTSALSALLDSASRVDEAGK